MHHPGRIKTTALAFALAVTSALQAQTEIEPNNTYTTATAVVYNTAMSGSTGACSPADNSLDYFSINPTSQGVLRVRTTMSNTGTAPISVTFQVRSSSTAVLGTYTVTAGANGVPVNDSFLFPCRGVGTYYISIPNPGSSVCTNYSFTYDIIDPAFANDAEPNDTYTSALTVPVNTWSQGQVNFHYGDNSDWYRLDLPTQGVLHIEWEAEHADASPGTATISLRQTSTSVIQNWDVPVGANSTAATGAVSIDCRSNTNHYLINVASAECGTSYRFRYTVTAPVFANDVEPNDAYTQAIALPHSTPTEGHINFSTYVENSDYYRLDLPTQGVLNVHWQAEHAGAGEGTATIRLRSSSTSLIETWTMPVGGGSEPESRTVSIPCRSNTGHYYLDVVGETCGISYRFSYTVTPPVFANDTEPNDTYTQAIVLPHSTPTEGQINFSTYVENSDYYRLDLPSNGVLHVQWEAEHAGMDPGTATIRLRNTSTAVLQEWTMPVGANSAAVSHVVSMDCQGDGNHYYLDVVGVSCGISYRLSYSVTAPVFGIAPVAGTTYTSAAPMVNSDSSSVQGQLNFHYGPTNAYYRVQHAGGPLVLLLQAEHAGGDPADYSIRLRSASTAVLQTETRSAGAGGTPQSATVDFGTRAAAIYYVELSGGPCGMSFAINCNDSDGDGVCNYFDLCPGGPEPGTPCNDGDLCTINDVIGTNCGCAGTLQDTDDDGACDANDGCPFDPLKTAPGHCGCGNPEPGAICDDNNTNTVGDVVTDACECAGTPIVTYDCPALQANIGDACNDNHASTENDVINDDCECVGTPIVTYDCPALQANIGDACNDNNASTENDVINASCVCVGTPIVTYDCEELQANIGDACNDNNAATENDVINASCECVGTPIVTYDCEELQANIGDACNDNNASTENDVINGSCVCAGTPIVTYDCEELQANIGDACNDNNASTENDVINASCECAGTPIVTYDCEELQANIGDACNDNNASTENDVINASCECVGTPIVTYDCPALQANIGDACNDNNASTENDVINASCVCAGTPIVTYDCEELQANIGDACNDNNASTENDVINASCECVGTPIVTYDCPALQANIGDACNDNNAGTINDVVTSDCVCAGTPTNCTENLQLAITLDAFGSQTTWQLKDETANVVAAGGPYADGLAGTVVNEAICVPQGCYQLVVNDNAGNGISAGGYVLTDAQGRRVVDATGNFGEVSQVLGGANNTVPQALCLPLSGARMLAGVCDKPSRLITAPVYASTVPGATMYQYWIFDPHGTYSRKLAVNSTQFVPGNLVTLPVPVNVDLNICVRPMVNGAYLPFGQVCRYRFVPHGTASISLSAMDLQTGVNLFPNPNRTRQVNLAFSGVLAEGLPIGIDLYDAFGKQVHSEQIAAADETFNHVLALDADLATGLYMVNITIDGQRFTKRLVLE